MLKPGMVSIWFLIGLLLTAYGLIITAASFYAYFVPPASQSCRHVVGPVHSRYGLVLLLALPAEQNQITAREAGIRIRSENVLQPGLNIPHGFRGVDHAECSGRQDIGGSRQPIRMVRKVECLESKLQ